MELYSDSSQEDHVEEKLNLAENSIEVTPGDDHESQKQSEQSAEPFNDDIKSQSSEEERASDEDSKDLKQSENKKIEPLEQEEQPEPL